MKFLGQPKESLMSRRVQAGRGVYGVKLFDFARPEGFQEVPDEEAMIDPDLDGIMNNTTYSNRSVAVFVLDVRSNKSPWKKGSEAYFTDYEGDFLGEHQWIWFEKAIARSQAAVNVVVSGLQFHSNMVPNPNWAEGWDKFPRAQQRLFNALLQDGVQAPILISGDVHMTQLARKDCQQVDGRSATRRRQKRSLIEMTTSGMTHSWGTVSSPPLSNPKQRPSFYEWYERFVLSTTMHILHYTSPWTSLLKSEPIPMVDGLYPNGGQDGAKVGLQYSLEKNFGELEFDWSQRTVTMRSIGETPSAPPLLSASWSLDQLNGVDPIPGSLLNDQEYLIAAGSYKKRPATAAVYSEWMCLNHRGDTSFFSQTIGHLSALGGLSIALPIPMLVPVLIYSLLRRWTTKLSPTSPRTSSTATHTPRKLGRRHCSYCYRLKHVVEVQYGSNNHACTSCTLASKVLR